MGRVRRRRRPRIGHLRHLHSGIEQVIGHDVSMVVRGYDEGAFPRRGPVDVQQSLYGSAEHDPGKVVVVEDGRTFRSPCRHDHPLRAELDEAFALAHRQEVALIEGDGRGSHQRFDVRLPGHRIRQLFGNLAARQARVLQRLGMRDALAPQAPPDALRLVDQGYFHAASRRFQGRGGPCRACSHDHQIGAPVFVLVAGVGFKLQVHLAQPGNPAHHRLRQAPEERVNQRFVVKPHRHQVVQSVQHRENVEASGGPGVLALDPEAGGRRHRADADVGDAVHVHEAVGAVAGEAEQAPGTMVFEAAAEDSDAGCVKRRSDGVALAGFHLLAVIGKGNLPGGARGMAGGLPTVSYQVMRPSGRAFAIPAPWPIYA